MAARCKCNDCGCLRRTRRQPRFWGRWSFREWRKLCCARLGTDGSWAGDRAAAYATPAPAGVQLHDGDQCFASGDGDVAMVAATNIFAGKIRGVQATRGWDPLWEGTGFQELRLAYPEPADGASFLRCQYPSLRILSFCGQIGDEFLEGLASAQFPRLTDLDVRATRVSEEGVCAFIAAPRTGLPRSRRMGIAFARQREESYHDWNGAVVGSGFEPMSRRELESAFFAGSSLRWMPEIERWPRQASQMRRNSLRLYIQSSMSQNMVSTAVPWRSGS